MMSTPNSRSGITLLEVIIALAIFAGSGLVLARLLEQGTDAIERARLETDAALIAESIMDEISAGVLLPRDQHDLDRGGSEWHCSVRISDGPLAGLRRVEVQVIPRAGGTLERHAGRFHFVLERWIHQSFDSFADGPGLPDATGARSR